MRKILGVFAMLVTISGCRTPAPPVSRSPGEVLRDAVVKIHVTIQHQDYAMPWQARRPGGATGSGYIIGNRRILTNAHIVSDAKFLEVQREGDPRRFPARVDFVGHDCDLATIVLENEADAEIFFKDRKRVELAKDLPTLGDDVTVIGYPMGGDRISTTRGVVSRIDYSVYTHSGVDSHLVLQVDAAINPGNSGGPIVYQGKVVGLAFQGISWAENIGYGIPVPVLNHFLTDIKDGVYHGYPELGVAYLDLRNKALARNLRVPEGTTGVVVYYVDPFSSAKNHLMAGDVLNSIEGHVIANDGTITHNGNPVDFHELVEQKQWGDAIEFEITRKGISMTLSVPLKNPRDPYIFRRDYDRLPNYFVTGGLVFSPLTRSYLATLGSDYEGRNSQQLIYYSRYAKMDALYKDREEFVVLTRRLPHTVNTYAGEFLNGIVTDVNGVAVRELKDVKAGFAQPTDGFHVIRFAGIDSTLVLDAKAVSAADPAIVREYGIPASEHMGVER